MKKIGLFGGTFDPIHCGHLNLAFELMEKRQLNEVWFIPNRINPFKVNTFPTPIEHRIDMIQAAIEDIPQFFLKDIEKKLPLPSYTIHTLKAILAREFLNHSSNQFYLILGEDAIPGFSRWHLVEEIVELIPLLIGSRTCPLEWAIENSSEPIQQAIQKGWTKTGVMDISSTEIRNRLKFSRYCGHLLPFEVLNYIKKNHLYHPN